MKKTGNMKYLYRLLWALFVCMTILLGIFTACRFFPNDVYNRVYVTGSSMYPTLNATPGRCDIGLIDKSEGAINSFRRFDIIITYYPWRDYHIDGHYKTGDELLDKEQRSYKVKRIIGFPGETVTIEKDYSITIYTNSGEKLIYDCDQNTTEETENLRLPYRRNIEKGGKINERARTYVLEENRYFVMGDNWDVSDDCSSNGSNQEPLYRENLVGRLTCIIGTCVNNNKVISDEKYFTPIPY